MKLFYIAGQYRAYRKDNNYDIDTMLERTMEMRRVARKYLEMGYAIISPLTNYYLLDSDKLTDTFWLDVDRVLISKCDGIVMMPGWEMSRGATSELKLAKELGLEVIYD